ncbi:MAG TPA: DUF6428 family protein [Verrucomicrobiae bacterium]|nr:DUF6428 family protein [Verrucomicrobiae bacterium]
MKLVELKTVLARNPAAQVRFHLPDGELVPAHAHVTEVARIDKRFIDCGGTLRTETLCRLQTWLSDDVEHRLTAGKLAKIFTKAEDVLLTDDLDVDVEHEVGYITQFPLGSVEVANNQVIFHLTERHTACLAMDKCLPPAAAPSEFSPLKFNFKETPSARHQVHGRSGY